MRDKLDARTKWSYCIGATGRDAAYALVSMYLILYAIYHESYKCAVCRDQRGNDPMYGLGCDK